MLEPYLAWADPGAARIDEVLSDGDELHVMGGLRVVHAPGHTPGSVSFHFPARGILIVGDAIQHKFGRLLPPSRVFSQDMVEAARSIAKLAQLDFETLCFSHFRPILRDGSRRLRELAATSNTTVVADAAG
jgi:glyoxylase-like metal-dependent hydrolase (beta-lactamase superfamily II)